jgi:translation initiation factor eIF-2B subunit epsilon
MSTNASDHQVRRAVVTAFVKRIHQLIKSGIPVKDAVAEVFEAHSELVERCIFDKAQSDKADQVDFLLLLQADVTHKENGDSILLQAATKMSFEELIDDEGFYQWWANEKSTESDDMRKVREKTEPLIDFLHRQAAESGSESEEESEEDEDEDSE